MAAVDVVGPNGEQARMTERRLAILAEQGWRSAAEVAAEKSKKPVRRHHPDPEATAPEKES